MSSRRNRQRRDDQSRKYRDAQDYGQQSLDRRGSTLNLPEGVSRFVPKEGVYTLDIIPYVVGRGNPRARRGEMFFVREYFIHRIGVDNQRVICPRATTAHLKREKRLKCPVCEHLGRRQKQPGFKKEEFGQLKPKACEAFNLRDRGEKEKGVQIYEVSPFCFGDQLREAISTEGMRNFHRDDEGSSLVVKFKEKDGGSFSFINASRVSFKERSPLTDRLLAKALCLDDIMNILPYDEIKELFFEGRDEDADEEDDEDEDEEDLDEDEDDEDDDEVEAKRRKKKSKSKKRRRDDDDDEIPF